MNGIEHEPAAGRENVDAFADLIAHFVRRAEGQGFLRIDSAAPKHESVAELRFQLPGVHSHRRTLHGVQDVKAAFDQRRQKRVNRAAGMLEGFPGCVRVHPGVEFLVVAKPEVAERFFRTKERLLRSEIRTAEINHVNGVAENVVYFLQIGQRDFELTFKDRVNVPASGHRGNVPLGNVANPFRMFELRSGNGADVPEAGTADAENDAASRCLAGIALSAKRDQRLVGNRLELFEIVFHPKRRVVDRLLTNDSIEEKAGFRHLPRRRNAAIAAGIEEHVRFGFINLKTIADQNDLSPGRSPFLPVFVLVAELRPGRKDAARRHAECVEQIVVGQAEHLARLMHLDRFLFQAVVPAQPGQTGNVYPRHRRRTEIKRQRPVLVLQGTLEDVTTGEGFFQSSSQWAVGSGQWAGVSSQWAVVREQGSGNSGQGIVVREQGFVPEGHDVGSPGQGAAAALGNVAHYNPSRPERARHIAWLMPLAQ